MFRGLRRRLAGERAEPLTRLQFQVLAVSPFEEEPDPQDGYQPLLLVQSDQVPGDATLAPDLLQIGSLLFVEWAVQRRDQPLLVPRLVHLVPRLRLAVRGGQLGPGRYAAHRERQQYAYFHHRPAATYSIGLLREPTGVAVTVQEQVQKGLWTAAATTQEAATLAPYETLLHLEPAAGLAYLDTLAAAVAQWEQHQPAHWPQDAWLAATAGLDQQAGEQE